MPDRRPLEAGGVADALVRATLKLEPSLLIPDGTASGWLFALSIVIGFAPDWTRLTVCPFWMAVAPLKATEPKLSSGTTPFGPEGASSIHSAEDRLDA